MIDRDNRIIVFGDNDVKMACTSNGVMFGDANIPDNEDDIESSYEFGIMMSMMDIIDFHKSLCKLDNKPDDDLELIITGVTFKFKTRNDLEIFKNSIIGWAASVVRDAKILTDYIVSVCK